MLAHCAPEHTVKETGHYRCIRYRDKEWPNFPLGKHGGARDKGRSSIQGGHVKNMAKHFGILDCAKKHIEMLRH